MERSKLMAGQRVGADLTERLYTLAERLELSAAVVMRSALRQFARELLGKRSWMCPVAARLATFKASEVQA